MEQLTWNLPDAHPLILRAGSSQSTCWTCPPATSTDKGRQSAEWSLLHKLMSLSLPLSLCFLVLSLCLSLSPLSLSRSLSLYASTSGPSPARKPWQVQRMAAQATTHLAFEVGTSALKTLLQVLQVLQVQGSAPVANPERWNEQGVLFFSRDGIASLKARHKSTSDQVLRTQPT